MARKSPMLPPGTLPYDIEKSNLRRKANGNKSNPKRQRKIKNYLPPSRNSSVKSFLRSKNKSLTTFLRKSSKFSRKNIPSIWSVEIK
jgi:hypothetical protein